MLLILLLFGFMMKTLFRRSSQSMGPEGKHMRNVYDLWILNRVNGKNCLMFSTLPAWFGFALVLILSTVVVLSALLEPQDANMKKSVSCSSFVESHQSPAWDSTCTNVAPGELNQTTMC
mmetsp:Transcript_29605/g.61903  ORF Transcript_29605/g.61903 Transcript_29605/m.61903 type:complete len:119 (+) Transcript_29605:745-1101(+)